VTGLPEIREGWNAAADDAMFNILTLPEKQGGGWDPDEFFAHGWDEIDAILTHLDELNLLPAGRWTALDFGCGVGRLTQALAEDFEDVLGVDISARMTTLARRYAKDREFTNVRFATGSKPNLRWLGDVHFDFIYSVITLQHMPQDLQRGYIEEFVRLLAPGGRAVFQVTEGADMENGHLSMYGVYPGDVFNWVTRVDGKVLHSEPSPHTGDIFTGRLYVVGP
jgi:SAM-dependent methyltransferase